MMDALVCTKIFGIVTRDHNIMNANYPFNLTILFPYYFCLPFDSIQSTPLCDLCLQKHENQLEEENQGQQPKTMSNYLKPQLTKATSSIIRLEAGGDDLEIRASIIQLVWFDRLQDKGLNVYLVTFLEICEFS